jgi:hypothetical protein
LDNYQFTSINYEKHENVLLDIIFVGRKEEVPETANVIHTFYYPDGEISLNVATSNESSFIPTNIKTTGVYKQMEIISPKAKQILEKNL